MAKLEAALTAHVGGAPSAPQRVLIQRAAWLQLHLAQLDAQLINKGGIATGHDTNQYLAWSNGLARLLNQLGLDAAAATPPTMADLAADHRQEAARKPSRARKAAAGTETAADDDEPLAGTEGAP